MSGEDWCPFPNGEIGNCHERRPHHHYNPRPGAAWEIVYTDGVEPTTDRIRLTDDEHAAVDRVLHPQPVRQIRVGETFDLAPHEKAEVVIPGGDGRTVFYSLDGGEHGMRGVRIG